MGLFASKESVSVLCIGLDNSGKTTIINRLKPEEAKVADVTATVGFSKEIVIFGNFEFSIFDMAGAQRFRNLWEKQYANAKGVIFVIDASDEFRLVSVKYELELLLQNELIASKKRLPILFFANKMDLPKALSPAELSEKLNLPGLIAERPFQILYIVFVMHFVCRQSNALAGVGLEKGMQWLSEHIGTKE